LSDIEFNVVESTAGRFLCQPRRSNYRAPNDGTGIQFTHDEADDKADGHKEKHKK